MHLCTNLCIWMCTPYIVSFCKDVLRNLSYMWAALMWRDMHIYNMCCKECLHFTSASISTKIQLNNLWHMFIKKIEIIIIRYNTKITGTFWQCILNASPQYPYTTLHFNCTVTVLIRWPAGRVNADHYMYPMNKILFESVGADNPYPYYTS